MIEVIYDISRWPQQKFYSDQCQLSTGNSNGQSLITKALISWKGENIGILPIQFTRAITIFKLI